ncbi:glycyl-radical enzyme activating protein [Synergistaceae bacterium OttesenSCG-928-I11]|nr:glycyl-radical enzyme activating protein [Synergistaceae bacterium OttesenSCG-928-I11]
MTDTDRKIEATNARRPQAETTGRVFDIKRYTLHDGPGIRVSIHLKGCPLSCWWCHNPESQRYEPQVLFRPERCISCGACKGLDEIAAAEGCPAEARELCGVEMTVNEVMRAIMKERMFFEQSGGGVTLTGGEPLGQPAFAVALLEACKKNELHTAVDTCGFADWGVFEVTLPYTDLYLFDIKHMDPEKHRLYTGVDNEIILQNLVRLGEAGAAIFARMPFIPGINTDEKNLHDMGRFLKDVRGIAQLNLLPYHSAAEDKHSRWNMDYKPGKLYPPTENALRKAAELMEGYGIKTVIGG